MILGAALGGLVTKCRAMGTSSHGISMFASDVDIQDLPGLYPAQPTVRNLLSAGRWDSMISKGPSNPYDSTDGLYISAGKGSCSGCPHLHPTSIGGDNKYNTLGHHPCSDFPLSSYSLPGGEGLPCCDDPWPVPLPWMSPTRLFPVLAKLQKWGNSCYLPICPSLVCAQSSLSPKGLLL